MIYLYAFAFILIIAVLRRERVLAVAPSLRDL